MPGTRRPWRSPPDVQASHGDPRRERGVQLFGVRIHQAAQARGVDHARAYDVGPNPSGPFRSDVQVRANDRSAAFVALALYTLTASHPLDVSLYAGDVGANLLHRGDELGLASPRDEHIRTVGHQLLGRGESDPAVATSDQCNFPFELLHGDRLPAGTTTRLNPKKMLGPPAGDACWWCGTRASISGRRT